MYPSFTIFPYLYVTWYTYYLLLPLLVWNVYVSQWPYLISWPGQTGFTSEFTCPPQPRYSGRSLRNIKISLEQSNKHVHAHMISYTLVNGNSVLCRKLFKLFEFWALSPNLPFVFSMKSEFCTQICVFGLTFRN